MAKIKFIIIGTGNRGLGCFAKGLLGFENKGTPEFKEKSEITALVDSNLTRGRTCAKEIGLPDVPVFKTPGEAQKEAPADWCIVTTPDYTHCKVVCEALESGLNVVVDKPLATSVQECQKIIDKMNATGKEVIVGHNYRYSKSILEAKKRVLAGDIGAVLSVEAAEILSLNHGGDYFHRWHSEFDKSAGLMNHKCCHFLDIICWTLDDDPMEVSAMGGRDFYVPRPDLNHGTRCTECDLTETCPHYYNMDNWDGVHRRMYGDAEHEDGYIRDLCVFSDRHTINDRESLNIRFKKGTLVSFSMTTFAPKEYTYFNYTGTKGRIEVGSNPVNGKAYLRIISPDGSIENVDITVDKIKHEHGHGGADIALIADILGLGSPDPLQKAAPSEALRAVSIADMAARSIANGGRVVKFEETGKDFPPAPPQKS